MNFISEGFPLVWMSKNNDGITSMEEGFAIFEALLARKEAFVLLCADETEPEHEHTKEENHQISRWMKKNKPELKAYVKGMIQIEPSAAKRLAAKPFSNLFAKFWGYPLFLVASKDKALSIANVLLASSGAQRETD